MADEMGAAVVDAPVVDAGTESFVDEPSQSTEQTQTQDEGQQQQQQDRQDNRRQPDALRKRIAELRRQADSVTDPAAKEALLKDAKALNDLVGKARAYEAEFPTVREVREVRALLDAVGGRDGLTQMQTTLSNVEQIDAMLTAGDASVIQKMWEEAPEGMPKLVSPIVDRFAQEKPQEYERFIAPRAVQFIDKSGFPQAFDAMAKAYEEGNPDLAKQIKRELIQFIAENRQQAQQQKQADPEVERLRQELETRKKAEDSQQVDRAYNAVVEHAGPQIDRVLKPMVAKLGLTSEQYRVLRNHAWDQLQNSRNEDATYKLVAPAKQKQGYDKWTEYAQRWTQDHAEEAARAMVKLYYGHQMKNGAQTSSVTAPVKQPGIQMGKEPAPSEIDYGPKGIQAARKAGFKDVGDMILSGQAPLKAGGIRKWR